jgi:hypothetical protein
MWSAVTRGSAATGNGENPQFPVTSVVTPCNSLLSASGWRITLTSECVWMSTKPGAVTRPVPSITCAAGTSAPIRPTTAIRSRTMPRSAGNSGAPVPSTTVE